MRVSLSLSVYVICVVFLAAFENYHWFGCTFCCLITCPWFTFPTVLLSQPVGLSFFSFFFFVELLPRLLWPSPNLKHSYSSIRLSGSAFALMHVSRSLLKPISPHLTKSALFHCKSSYCTAPPPTCISMCLCLVPKHFPINLHQPVSHFLKLLFKSFSRFPLLPDKYSVEHFVFFLCFSKRRCTLMSRTIPQTDGAMPK